MSFTPPTTAEQVAVASIKGVLLSEQPELKENPAFTDITILRFYRGHKGVEENALRGLRRHFKWRQDENVDTINDRTSTFEKEIYSGKVMLGRKDKKGRPISYNFAFQHDANNRDLQQMKDLTVWVLESLRKSTNPEEERIVICFDLNGFALKCMDYEVVKNLIGLLQSHYPDILDQLYVIDAPFIFSACWLIIKPWIDPVTSQKIKFISRSELPQYFDEDQIVTKEMSLQYHADYLAGKFATVKVAAAAAAAATAEESTAPTTEAPSSASSSVHSSEANTSTVPPAESSTSTEVNTPAVDVEAMIETGPAATQEKGGKAEEPTADNTMPTIEAAVAVPDGPAGDDTVASTAVETAAAPSVYPKEVGEKVDETTAPAATEPADGENSA